MAPEHSTTATIRTAMTTGALSKNSAATRRGATIQKTTLSTRTTGSIAHAYLVPDVSSAIASQSAVWCMAQMRYLLPKLRDSGSWVEYGLSTPNFREYLFHALR